MRSSSLVLLTVLLCPRSSYSQQQAALPQLSAGESGIVAAARERYYKLPAAGFQSMTCGISFDLAAVPQIPADPDDPIHKLMAATQFGIMIDDKGVPTVKARYPEGTSDADQKAAAKATQFLGSVVTGVFQVWAAKGFYGPVPLSDGPIESVVATEKGYKMALRTRGAPVYLLLDKSYAATDALGGDGKAADHLSYVATPEGLVLSGLRGESETSPGVKSEVQYEFQTVLIEGLRVPGMAHLRVGTQMNVRMMLGACVVKKGR